MKNTRRRRKAPASFVAAGLSGVATTIFSLRGAAIAPGAAVATAAVARCRIVAVRRNERLA